MAQGIHNPDVFSQCCGTENILPNYVRKKNNHRLIEKN